MSEEAARGARKTLIVATLVCVSLISGPSVSVSETRNGEGPRSAATDYADVRADQRNETGEEAGAGLALSVSVRDTPSDDGSSLTLAWQAVDGIPATALFAVFRQARDETAFVQAGKVRAGAGIYEDRRGLKRTEAYRYRLALETPSGFQYTQPTRWVRPEAQWFNRDRTKVAVAVPVFCVLVLVSIVRARRGAGVSIRRIPGLEAIDEAVGRATEMGKPILFSPGLDEADQPGTIAALAILGKIVGRAAQAGTRTLVPNRDPVVMTVAREIAREACLVAGRPEFYRDEDVYYATYSQFGYAASVAGTMVRERPAVNLFVGKFYGEALILAETGYTIGAMQIAASDSDTQLPFFITTCDYTLMGEELYAASAYLSREPVLLGSVKGQDLAKAVLIALLAAGMILALFGLDVGALLR